MTVYGENEKADFYIDLKNLILINILVVLLISNCFALF